MVSAPPRFSDIQSHWARPFIEALAQRGVVRGFSDGTFRPNQSISRAEFAALLRACFTVPVKRPYVPFVDVPANHWAAAAIRWSYETGFLSGFPNREFRPQEPLPRAQALVSVVNGLGIVASQPVPLAEVYQDARAIPGFATGAIAAATEVGLVVNHPDRTQLRPLQNITRGEIAATLYQCLVYLDQAAPIESEWIVRWVRLVTVSHEREFRAAWVSTVWNIDFPSKGGLTPAQQQEELIGILDQLKAMNFNAVILQVRPEGDALYASSLEPWSFWLTGVQGQAPEPLYDPLAFAIAECRKRNLELHAWFNPYRARTSRQIVNVRPHLAATHADVVYPWGNQLWMDPGARVVQDRTFAVILDVVRRYDVDGIHLDDYFYPYPISGQTFPDDKTYQDYRAGGGTLSLNDWRRENVNQMVQRLASGIRAAKPHVKFGISPFGIYRPGQPPQIRGLDAYDQLFADALKWLQQGWVDYLAPQLYWRIDPPAQSYPVLLQWWAENNPRRRHLYAGNNLSQLDGKAWDLNEVERQVALTRQLKTQNPVGQWVLGNIFYSAKAFTSNREGVRDRFQTTTYRALALPPTMPWLNAQPLPTPRAWVRNNQIFWQPLANVRAWTIYRQEGNRWLLHQILPGTTTRLMAPTGAYALCAVDRLANETPGVLVTVRSPVPVG